MLALTAQIGDTAVRTDVSKTYILSTSDPTQVGNWIELLGAGEAPVQSVAGRTGTVVLQASDIASGVFVTSRLGSGTGVDGTRYLSGDSTWKTLNLAALADWSSTFTEINNALNGMASTTGAEFTGDVVVDTNLYAGGSASDLLPANGNTGDASFTFWMPGFGLISASTDAPYESLAISANLFLDPTLGSFTTPDPSRPGFRVALNASNGDPGVDLYYIAPGDTNLVNIGHFDANGFLAATVDTTSVSAPASGTLAIDATTGHLMRSDGTSWVDLG
jgi:hypothetical protein